MTALGMTTLHLRIVEFKFTHNLIICNRLPDTELIFGIDIQKKFSISYACVTLWCYYATAPGTLGFTRHLLGLVSWVCE